MHGAWEQRGHGTQVSPREGQGPAPTQEVRSEGCGEPALVGEERGSCTEGGAGEVNKRSSSAGVWELRPPEHMEDKFFRNFQHGKPGDKAKAQCLRVGGPSGHRRLAIPDRLSLQRLPVHCTQAVLLRYL